LRPSPSNQRHLPFSAFFGGALDVRKVIMARFLPHPDQQLRKLPARRAGLR
jgi:hypothetical protein